MSREKALSTWHSVRTTFLMFLIVVPIVMVLRARDEQSSVGAINELVAPGVGIIVIAGVLAEICRRMLNRVMGEHLCHWGPSA